MNDQSIEDLINKLGNDFERIRTLRKDGVINLFIVDVAYGKFSYSDTSLKDALLKALTDKPTA